MANEKTATDFNLHIGGDGLVAYLVKGYVGKFARKA